MSVTDAANTNFSGTFTPAVNGPGNYVRFRITATGFTLEAVPTAPEGGTRRAPINGLQIVPVAPAPPPDFTVTESPHSRTVIRGSSASYTISVTATNGFNAPVTLSASGLPAGTTATFNPSAINGSGSSTLTLATGSTTPPGTFTVHVTGTSGTTTRSTHVVLIVEAPPPAGGGTISVDFVGSHTVAMAPAEIAGVVAAANWNNAFGATRADPQTLVDESGRPTAAGLTWSSPGGTWVVPIDDQPGSARMMKGYLDTANTTTTSLTVTGLPEGSYDVYLYADGDNKIYDRGAAYALSGAGMTANTIQLTDPANTNFRGEFVRADGSAGNYVRFSITGTGFTIVAQPTTPEGGTRRAPVNGLQIVPTSVAPASIGIDFAGNSPTAMTPSERAGVIPQTNWNAAAGAVRSTPLPLLDANGAATAESVTWSANGGWSLPIADTAGDMRLMRGYLDTHSTSVTTVTVTGLQNRAHDVYIYADGDNREFARSAIYRLTAGGTATEILLTDPANTNFSGAFTPAAGGNGNYVKFSINAGEFTIAAIPSTAASTTRRAPINAIQVVPR